MPVCCGNSDHCVGHLLAMAFADYGGAQLLEEESLVEVLTPRTIVAIYRLVSSRESTKARCADLSGISSACGKCGNPL